MSPSNRPPNEPQEPPDKLSALYQSLGRESSPQHLDDLVLEQAKTQLVSLDRKPKSELKTLFTWERIASVAAVMVLSVYVVLDVTTEKSIQKDSLMDDGMVLQESSQIPDAPQVGMVEPAAETLVDDSSAETISQPQSIAEGLIEEAPKISVEDTKARVNAAAPRPPEPVRKKESKVDQSIFMDAAPQAELMDQVNAGSHEDTPVKEVFAVPSPGKRSEDAAILEVEQPTLLKQKSIDFSKIPVSSFTSRLDDNYRVESDVSLSEVTEPVAVESVEEEIPPLEKPLSELQKRLDEIERIYRNGDVEIAKLAYAQLRIDYKEAGLPLELDAYLNRR